MQRLHSALLCMQPSKFPTPYIHARHNSLSKPSFPPPNMQLLPSLPLSSSGFGNADNIHLQHQVVGGCGPQTQIPCLPSQCHHSLLPIELTSFQCLLLMQPPDYQWSVHPFAWVCTWHPKSTCRWLLDSGCGLTYLAGLCTHSAWTMPWIHMIIMQ